MDFSFIICTTSPDSERVDTCIKTIVDLQIPNYEILIVGGDSSRQLNNIPVRFISFNESEKPGWITRKKNIAAQQANFENLVIMHDYFSFDYDWYDNWVEFSNNFSWDIASNCILGINNQRIYTDWVTYDDPNFGKGYPLPYNEWTKTHIQYISGGYFLVKKKVFLENLLNENLVWNEAEDVEWSLRVREKYKILCNAKSIVRHTKWHNHLDSWKKSNKKYRKVFGNQEWKN